MAKPLKTFSVDIRGIRWKVYIHSPSSYEAIPGTENSDAITFGATRSMLFRSDTVSLVFVRHELLHAYVESFHLSSADITAKQLEEIFAEWLSNHVDEYCSSSIKLWKKIQTWMKTQKK